ncbi:hypothetical protein LE110_01510 [Escherichia coli]|nr:hypothetical protein [Escherichia coli]
MAKNDFKAFATDRSANVMSQEEWEALPALLSGFTAGKASSAQVNKVIRQASFIAAALAQFVSDKTQRDVLDNGDLPGFVELLGSGFAVEYLSRKNPFGDIKSDGTVKTALENLGLGEAAKRDVGNSAGQIPDMSYWSSPSGGINFPNGLQMRFGTVAGKGAKTFSTPFTNQCYGIVFGQTYTPNVWIFSPMYRAADLSKTGFSFANRSWSGDSGTVAQDAGESVFYIALGD